MKILVGYKDNNEQTKAYRIVGMKDGIHLARTFVVMARPWDGTKYLAEGNTVKMSNLKNIREEELEGVDDEDKDT